ncbi:prolipoprotein diacylglyceryl transferase [Coralliovum pocilloporae]|uniref:prolipoprotein diacylglyceryl transferase n=1 Tax=Coralliovum pocilloporae TaxID=3066369 RepID=UPI0033079232
MKGVPVPVFALPFPAIDPVLFEFGPIVIRWYALAYIAGIFIGLWYAKRLAAHTRLWPQNTPAYTPVDLDDFLLWAALGVILGGRAGYVLFYDSGSYLENPLEIIAVWNGGMAFHGGFLGATLAMILFARRRGKSVLSLFDLFAAAVPFGLFFGRIANFINGELFGRVTDVPWAVVFPHGGPLPRHPSQLYEAGLEGLLTFVLLMIAVTRFRTLHTPGLTAGLFTALYGLFRFTVEWFRMPDAHIGYLSGGLTMGMLLSLPMILAGLVLMGYAKRSARARA